MIEEKRIQQEISLQSYLNKLVNEDRERWAEFVHALLHVYMFACWIIAEMYCLNTKMEIYYVQYFCICGIQCSVKIHTCTYSLSAQRKLFIRIKIVNQHYVICTIVILYVIVYKAQVRMI